MPQARLRGAIFSTSSEVTISIFSKNICFFILSLSLLFDLRHLRSSGWVGGSAYLDFLQPPSLACPVFDSGSRSSESSLLPGKPPRPERVGGVWGGGSAGGGRLLSPIEEEKACPLLLQASWRGQRGGRGGWMQEKQKQCYLQPREVTVASSGCTPKEELWAPKRVCTPKM